jgi:hypothetical protein
MSNLTTDAWYVLVTGPLLPLIISIINQPKWSDGLRAIVAGIVAAIAGAAVAWHAGLFAGGFAGVFTAANAVVLFRLASSFYKHFWKPTGVSPAIEHATSVGGK